MKGLVICIKRMASPYHLGLHVFGLRPEIPKLLGQYQGSEAAQRYAVHRERKRKHAPGSARKARSHTIYCAIKGDWGHCHQQAKGRFL